MVEEKRIRGGQPGNHNALKHGYYSKVFNKKDRVDYCSAGDVEGIDEEIALLRRVIKKAASSDDDKQVIILVRATGALNRLIRTRYKLLSGRHDRLKDAIVNVVHDILIPMGVNLGDPNLIKKLSEK
jgi:hypothetical protein